MKNEKGFSLIELSIVLIIIGLLIVGISAGDKLIRSAKLNNVVQEFTKHRASILTFQLAYDALPGDFDQAESLWSTNSFTGTNDGTLNGDGDGFIEYKIPLFSGTLESAWGWQQLSLAKMTEESIDIQHTGLSHGYTNYGSGSGINASGTSFSSTACYTFTNGFFFASGLGILSDKNTLTLGDPWYNNACAGRLFSPSDAFFIDQKFDDGSPNSGILNTLAGNIIDPALEAVQVSGGLDPSANCLSGSSYIKGVSSAECIIIFLLD
jgi:prepilin-type N-terminal cleavage/methylation domain-containing protein